MCKHHSAQTTGHPTDLPADLSLDDAMRVPCPAADGSTITRTLIPVDLYQAETSSENAEQWILKAWDVEQKYYALFDMKTMIEIQP